MALECESTASSHHEDTVLGPAVVCPGKADAPSPPQHPLLLPARLAAVVAAGTGALHLLAWLGGILPALGSRAIIMKTNAALAMLLAGVGLLLLIPVNAGTGRRRAGQILAAVALLLGAVTLLEHLTGWELHVDQLLATEPPGARATASPNRMGPPASISFVLTGLALLLLNYPIAQHLALLVGFLSIFSVLGHLYDVQALYGLARFTGIAFTSALMFMVLSLGMLCARPDVGIMARVTARDAGGAVIRRLLLPALVLPVLIGWLLLLGDRRGLYDERLGTALLIATFMVVFSMLIYYAGQRVSRSGEAAAHSQERLRLIADSVPALISYIDTDFRYQMVNRTYHRWFRKTLALMQGRHVREVLGEAAWERVRPHMARALAGEQVSYEEELPYQGTGPRWVHVAYSPDRAADGHVRGFAVLVTDISEAKRAEQALRETAQFPEQNPNPVLRIDRSGKVLYVNPACENLPHELRCAAGQPAPVRLAVMAQETLELATARELDIESEGRVFSFVFAPIAENGHVNLYGRDTTERHRAEQALAAAKEAAEAANAAKDHFLAVLSHELRTPLAPVLMITGALENDPEVPERLRADMSLIRRSVGLEVRLIDDLLDINRIARGKLELRSETLNIHVKLNAAVDICRLDIEEKGVRVEFELGAEAHHVVGDPSRLQQVFWNLLKNGIKFTPSGERILIRTSNPSKETVRVEVVDSGIGIEPDMLPRLFSAFEQGSKQVTRQFGGLGLGLAISKALVELHGGRITATSGGAGRGATFSVDLPVATERATQGIASPRSSETPQGLTILLVEDHEDTATIMKRVLTSAGHQVLIAGSVGEALGVASQHRFDILLSDLGLPDGSGLDVMRRLRELQPALRGIALSGYGMESDIQRSREAGFSEHLTKPVDLQFLKATIARIASA